MSVKKKLLTGVVVLGIIGVKIAIKFGASYGVTEAVVEASKNEAWGDDVKKTVVGSCSQAVIEEAKKAQTVLSEADLNTYSSSYCACLFTDIENQHIVPTKYNTYKMTEDEYVVEVDKIIGAYMDSEQGKKIVDTCIASAQQKISRLPASEVEEGDDEGIPENAAAIGTSSEGAQEESL